MTDEPNSVIEKFSFPVEAIEFITYQDIAGKKAYRFALFLQDVSETVPSVENPIADSGDIDTIVVPAREGGFKDVFLAQDR